MKVRSKSISYFTPDLGEAEAQAAVEVLRSGWLTTGTRTREFEERFAEAVDGRHAVAVNSCTAALHLALVALGVGAGDEVIVPTMTFAATAEVVAYTGATLVLVDVCPDTLCVDVGAVEAALTTRTKAVMPVHYGGQAADLAALRHLAQKHGFHIVEDAAHAFPARDDAGVSVGAAGDAVCFSFYANKTITTGEGGMLVTEDAEVADRARQLSLHGLDRNAWRRWETRAPWDYDIVETGFKYNLTDIAAAIGIVQLEKAGRLAQRRREIAELYGHHFASVETIEPLTVRKPEHSAWHLFVVRVPDELNQTRVISGLADRDIGTSVHYKPLHLHPHYEGRFGSFAVAEAQFRRIVSLPLWPGMSEAQVATVAEAVIEQVDR